MQKIECHFFTFFFSFFLMMSSKPCVPPSTTELTGARERQNVRNPSGRQMNVVSAYSISIVRSSSTYDRYILVPRPFSRQGNSLAPSAQLQLARSLVLGIGDGGKWQVDANPIDCCGMLNPDLRKNPSLVPSSHIQPPVPCLGHGHLIRARPDISISDAECRGRLSETGTELRRGERGEGREELRGWK